MIGTPARKLALSVAFFGLGYAQGRAMRCRAVRDRRTAEAFDLGAMLLAVVVVALCRPAEVRP